MNGLLDIIFFAVVAVFILIRLRNVLGQKNDEDDLRRQEKYRKYREVNPNSPKVVEFPGKKTESPLPPAVSDAALVSPDGKEGVDTSVVQAVSTISAYDKGFTFAWFMIGAKKAFEMVVEAFSKADEKTLKNLLSEEVFEQFQGELKTQEKQKRRAEITLISVLDCSVVGASIQKNMANFTVKFVSEQIRVTRDIETGKIVEGNATQIDRVEDTWTFSRNIRASNPNWQVTAT